MDKYFAFRKLMDFLADFTEVTDADMNYCYNMMRIAGENDGETITITVTIDKKEVKENA